MIFSKLQCRITRELLKRVESFSPEPYSPSQLVQCFRGWIFVRCFVNDVQIGEFAGKLSIGIKV